MRVNCKFCGKEFYKSPASNKVRCSWECRAKDDSWKGTISGQASNFWKRGSYKDGQGYVLVPNKSHPRAHRTGYVFEHILVAENKIGRSLGKEEVVHHINHIKNDNRPENLMVLTKSEHIKLHIKDERRKISRGPRRFYGRCGKCGRLLAKNYNRLVSNHECRANNTKGITWDKLNRKWRAKFCSGGKTIHVGRFESRDEALNAYKKFKDGFYEVPE